MADDIKIHKIPVEHIGVLWPMVQPWLERGLKAATDTSMAGILLGLKEGTDQLWAVLDGKEVIGAFLTSFYIDDDSNEVRYLAAYALGGDRLPDWAGLLGETMAEYAKHNKCKSVRFCGRPGWGRLLPSYQITGAYQGHSVFERAVS